jgi:alginate O-acetyltransferase complex protein AlgI
MLFNSYVFLFVFLPLTLLGYYAARRALGREASFVLLVICSLVYYAYWKFDYLLILLISIVLNYFLGLFLSRSQPGARKKVILILGVVLNLLALVYYKYANFLIDNLESLTGQAYSSLNILLPLAISFFTFQQVAYLVDAFKGEAKEYSFVHYCLFISFFPQLIAGPIVHHKEMLPQFMHKARDHFDLPMFRQGLNQFCFGIFKKVIIADNVALYATPVFFAADHGQTINATEAWIGILAYSFQLYFDFSAYSDMAIGIGKMFGIDLPKNFNSPYKSTSISDFWRRWHMTLSRFLRDYLYIALGGNRKGPTRRKVNLVLTMVIGGLWHGASWNFVAWGALHGLYLVVCHFWQNVTRPLDKYRSKPVYIFFAKSLTFFAVIMAWVLFRAESFDGALVIYHASFQFGQFSLEHLVNGGLTHIAEPIKALGMIAICAVIAFAMPNSQEFVEQSSKFANKLTLGLSVQKLKIPLAALASGLLVLSISSMNKVSEFLYFQF